MTKLILSCLLACSLVVFVTGCADDEHHTATTTTYDSSVSDSKSMHHR